MFGWLVGLRGTMFFGDRLRGREMRGGGVHLSIGLERVVGG